MGALPADEKWLYLFTHAAETDPETLADQLGDPPYREAIGVLQMISKSPEDLQYYEDRLKFLRDERGKLLAAEQDGEQRGLAIGRQEGMEKGMEKGKLAGRLQTLQELLGDEIASDVELKSLSIAALTTELSALQARLRSRDA